MSVVINIVLILASLVLIVAVLMQEGSKQGLGSIGGMAETFFGKNEAKSAEGKLLKITRITAIVFVVLALAATWLNARTYTVTYYDENGEEYFTEFANEVMMNNLYAQMGQEGYATVTYDEVYEANKAQFEAAGYSLEDMAKQIRTSYKKGDSIPQYPAPEKEGYNGIWVLGEKTDDGVKKIEGDVPATMGSKNITLIPEYTIGTYTVKIVDNGIPAEPAEPAEGETEAVEGETAEAETETEDNVIFELTAEFGTAIDYSSLAALPEVEEYYVFYSPYADAVASNAIVDYDLPETVPGYNLTLYVNYAHGNFVEYYVANDEGEETEVFPALQQAASQQIVALWQQINPMPENADEIEAYLTKYTDALGEDGEITASVKELYDANVQACTDAGKLDSIRQFVTFGEAFDLMVEAPAKEGFDAKWDPEVPEKGDGIRYQLHVVYTPAEEAEEVTEEATEEVAEEAPATVEAPATEDAPATEAE